MHSVLFTLLKQVSMQYLFSWKENSYRSDSYKMMRKLLIWCTTTLILHQLKFQNCFLKLVVFVLTAHAHHLTKQSALNFRSKSFSRLGVKAWNGTLNSLKNISRNSEVKVSLWSNVCTLLLCVTIVYSLKKKKKKKSCLNNSGHSLACRY